MPKKSRPTFSVLPPSRSFPRDRLLQQFVLVQDNWNDFSFQTLYRLYVAEKGGEHELIGDVKILKKGQTESDGLQITGDFEALDHSYCSLGQSLDYYQRLGELKPNTREKILKALRDVVRFPELEDAFAGEPGWTTSVLRTLQHDRHYRTLAKSVLTGNFVQLANIFEGFSFHCPNWSKAIEFRFDAPSNFGSKISWLPSTQISYLPDRVTVVVGRNASGKSTLLARLARVAHASHTDRESSELSVLGRLDPPGIGFPRVITVSYSAFDSFQIPGVNPEERRQIARDVEKGEGRFVFCGLRDIAGELRVRLSAESAGIPSKSYVVDDRVRSTFLKPIDKLADEFEATIARIMRLRKEDLFHRILSELFKEASFNDIRSEFEEAKRGFRSLFLGWSTGHKIVLQVIASLTAYTEPRSLVLLDEPESHLHPPLLAALMHAVRQLLRQQDAFGVIATHSPVVLQETLGRHVWIIRREGAITDVSSPSIETFGENVGTLTEHVFGLTSEATDFHAILRQLASGGADLETIEKVFEPHGLSMQARAYVMSLLATKNKK